MTGPRPLPAGLPEELGAVALLLGELPGIGTSSSVKLATLLAQNPDRAREIEDGLRALRWTVGTCSRCNFISKRDALCTFCSDRRRDDRLLCVVERVRDVLALDRAGWRGRFFVLGKLISPLEDITSVDLPIPMLVKRVGEMLRNDGGGEVLLALPSTTDGDATALVLAHRLGKEIPEGARPKITRIGKGLSTRADLADADQITIGHAVAARSSIGGEP